MPRRMGPVRQQRLCAIVCTACSALLCAACDSGVVRPLKLELAQDGGPENSQDSQDSQDGSTAGDSAGLGGAGGGTGGASGGLRSRDLAGQSGAATPVRDCAGDETSEQGLLEAINRAIDDGRFCPGFHKPLTANDDLRDLAQAMLCDDDPQLPSRGWRPLFWPSKPWAFRTEAASLEEAKRALFDAERRGFCEDTQRRPYEWAAVTRQGDDWAVLITISPWADPQNN